MISSLLEKACAVRYQLFEGRHDSAYRLFNGFYEGAPALAIDIYATSALLHNYSEDIEAGKSMISEATSSLQKLLPWINTFVVKDRYAAHDAKHHKGTVLSGGPASNKVREHGVFYAVDLCMGRDASLYLDTRNLREWALKNLSGKTVLNTFAYTGSLGVAAMAGGASQVVQLDRNKSHLDMAKTSCMLNGFSIQKRNYVADDFFAHVGLLRKLGETFDCVFLDPPFFSAGNSGTVDMINENMRLINKIRPLINDGGHLVAINNSVFVSGKAYMDMLHQVCNDGFLKLKEIIPVPSDFTGYPETIASTPISDPAPFNHSTKIAILEVKKK